MTPTGAVSLRMCLCLCVMIVARLDFRWSNVGGNYQVGVDCVCCSTTFTVCVVLAVCCVSVDCR